MYRGSLCRVEVVSDWSEVWRLSEVSNGLGDLQFLDTCRANKYRYTQKTEHEQYQSLTLIAYPNPGLDCNSIRKRESRKLPNIHLILFFVPMIRHLDHNSGTRKTQYLAWSTYQAPFVLSSPDWTTQSYGISKSQQPHTPLSWSTLKLRNPRSCAVKQLYTTVSDWFIQRYTAIFGY